MKLLTQSGYDAARGFLERRARPVDWAVFKHRFEGGREDAVIEVLAEYQNEDGGFGRGLEPDLRTPSSSALATGIALEVLREVCCPPVASIVTGAVNYLSGTFEPISKVWRAIPGDANNYPHAGWWHDEDGSVARMFSGFGVIPRASILASLHHFRTLVSDDWLEDVTEACVDFIETTQVDALRGDGFVYAAKLADASALSSRYRERLQRHLQAVLPEVITLEPEKWSGYCLTPLKAAPSPTSVAARVLREELQSHLDHTVAAQSDEGTWDPAWDWSKTLPEAWPAARDEWRGHLTLETLISLRAFGRIEDLS